MSTVLNWKIAGLAGEGIATTGMLFAKLALRQHYFVFTYGEYPSLIRGGHNTLQVSVSPEPIHTQVRHVDVLLALNEDAIKLHLEEISEKTVILVDKTNAQIDWNNYQLPATIIDVPFKAIALETTQGTLAENMVALGASAALFGFNPALLHQLIAEIFGRKGEEVVKKNQAAATAGHAQITAQPRNLNRLSAPTHSEQHVLLAGTEAIGLGALSAGLQFYAGYPMSPSSGLLHLIAEQEKHFPLVVKHTEDEIAAINQAVGASFAGARAMTGSASGGFALMAETTSLAGVAETPLVVHVAQRPGPATGLPTWTSQADLQFVLHAGHGEFPKVVIAPGTVEDCFAMTRQAFELAEKYQTQVYVVSDKYLLESAQSIPSPTAVYHNQHYSMVKTTDLPADNSYRRFEVTPEGYSPRSVPGQAHGLQLTNSYEHDEHGYATEDGAMAKQMVDKRLRKMAGLLAETPPPELLGPTKANTTLVCWGSTKLAVTELLTRTQTTHPGKLNAIYIPTLMPFHIEAFVKLAKQSQSLIMIEGNATGQCQLLIREQTGIEITESIKRYDGRPFYVEDLMNELTQRGVLA